MQNEKSIYRYMAVFVAGVFLGLLVVPYVLIFVGSSHMTDHHYSHGDHVISATTGDEAQDLDLGRKEFISAKDSMISRMISEGDYACCLEKPCTYCIEKTPGHGEGPTCNCLSDIMNGQHPCGECIGEILEGHGNRFLAPYFSAALAEELGQDHRGVIAEIIMEKYGIPVEDQV